MVPNRKLCSSAALHKSRHPTTTALVKIDRLQKRGSDRTDGRMAQEKRHQIPSLPPRLHKKRLRLRQKYVVVSPPPPQQQQQPRRTLIELITMESRADGRADGLGKQGRTKNSRRREEEGTPAARSQCGSDLFLVGCAKCPLALTEPAAEATCAAARPPACRRERSIRSAAAAACVRHRN